MTDSTRHGKSNRTSTGSSCSRLPHGMVRSEMGTSPHPRFLQKPTANPTLTDIRSLRIWHSLLHLHAILCPDSRSPPVRRTHRRSHPRNLHHHCTYLRFRNLSNCPPWPPYILYQSLFCYGPTPRVIAGTSQLSSHWAYSAPFALQWLWPLIILIGIPFAPESPWWLVRNNRLEEAEKALNRLSSGTVDNKLVLAMMVETDALELEMETGTRYWDVFKGTNLRRTENAVAVYTTQVFSGIYLVGYAAYFFQRMSTPSNMLSARRY
jgi:hypothetical protein